MSFGQKPGRQPQDRRQKVSELAHEIQQLDLRRQKQIENQKEIINRLLKGAWSYDDFAESMTARLSAAEAKLDQINVLVHSRAQVKSGPDAGKYSGLGSESVSEIVRLLEG